jgi:hypothetical protein
MGLNSFFFFSSSLCDLVCDVHAYEDVIYQLSSLLYKEKLDFALFAKVCNVLSPSLQDYDAKDSVLVCAVSFPSNIFQEITRSENERQCNSKPVVVVNERGIPLSTE